MIFFKTTFFVGLRIDYCDQGLANYFFNISDTKDGTYTFNVSF